MHFFCSFTVSDLLCGLLIISSGITHTHTHTPPLDQVLSGRPDGSSDLPLTANLSGAVLVFSLVCISGPDASQREDDRYQNMSGK